MVKALRIVIELHWGYSVKHPFFSASQPSFRFPPPTTLIGALAFAIASREIGTEILVEKDGLYSYTAELLDDIPWVAYRFLSIDPACIAETRDLTRVLIAPYVRRDNVYPGSPYVWAVQIHGKVYAPATEIEILYIVRDSIAGKAARCAWGIARLGTKESIASVRSVELLEVGTVASDVIETSYSFARSLAEPIEGVYTVSRLPIPSREWYRLGAVRDPSRYLDDYVVPRAMVRARVTERGAALKVGSLGIVIVPKQVAEHG